MTYLCTNRTCFSNWPCFLWIIYTNYSMFANPPFFHGLFHQIQYALFFHESWQLRMTNHFYDYFLKFNMFYRDHAPWKRKIMTMLFMANLQNYPPWKTHVYPPIKIYRDFKFMFILEIGNLMDTGHDYFLQNHHVLSRPCKVVFEFMANYLDSLPWIKSENKPWNTFETIK